MALVVLVIKFLFTLSHFLALSLGAYQSDFCHARNASCKFVESMGYKPQCVLSALAACEEVSVSPHFENELRNLARSIEAYAKIQASFLARPRNCQDVRYADVSSGVRTVYPYHMSPDWGVAVYCDQLTDGGGWTVIQRRDASLSTREDFYRSWIEYQLGFGNLKEEFWLGLEAIHGLTSSTLMELRVELRDFEGQSQYDMFSVFKVGDSASKYALTISGHFGNAGNSFYGANERYDLNGMKFTTRDRDNDLNEIGNCAERFKGAWWYNDCSRSHLNGLPHRGHHSTGDGIKYNSFKGLSYSLKYASMMIRPGMRKN